MRRSWLVTTTLLETERRPVDRSAWGETVSRYGLICVRVAHRGTNIVARCSPLFRTILCRPSASERFDGRSDRRHVDVVRMTFSSARPLLPSCGRRWEHPGRDHSHPELANRGVPTPPRHSEGAFHQVTHAPRNCSAVQFRCVRYQGNLHAVRRPEVTVCR